MKINQATHSKMIAGLASEPPPKKLHNDEPHNPGLIRDSLEKLGGVAMAATRLPGALLAGGTAGVYQGFRKGHDSDYQPKVSTATGIFLAAHAVKQVAKGALVGYGVAGLTGAALYGLFEVGESSGDIYLFLKGGSADEMGKLLTEAVDNKVKGGEGAVRGATKGFAVGTVSSVKSGTSTGFQEGKAMVSGAIQGLQFAGEEFGQALGPKGNRLQKIGTATAGAVAATLSVPAGIVLGALDSLKESSEPVTKTKRLVGVAASGAVAGGLLGMTLGGPVGAVLGAGVGAVLSLVSPLKAEKFTEEISKSTEQARSKSPDMGGEIANKRRDLLQSAVVGGLSGARQGWNSTVETLASA